MAQKYGYTYWTENHRLLVVRINHRRHLWPEYWQVAPLHLTHPLRSTANINLDILHRFGYVELLLCCI